MSDQSDSIAESGAVIRGNIIRLLSMCENHSQRANIGALTVNGVINGGVRTCQTSEQCILITSARPCSRFARSEV